MTQPLSLNPFEFRAGIYFEMQREINELRAELVALKAPRPPQDYFASKQAPLLHELLHQVIHGDFTGDHQDDLNLALRARKQLEELCKSFEKLKKNNEQQSYISNACHTDAETHAHALIALTESKS